MTIKDIAAYCGVSVSTVSRVLNQRPDVSPTVREKVERAIEECHYIPSNTARDLVRPQSDAIGVVVRGAEKPEELEPTLEDGLALVDKLRGEGLSLRDAVKRAAKELGLSRNQLYDAAVEK